MSVGIALSGNSQLFCVAIAITQISFNIFTWSKKNKMLLSYVLKSELKRIADIISQAMQDGDISYIEFHKILQEVDKYRKLTTDIRNQVKCKIKRMTKEQKRNCFKKKQI